MAFTDTELDYLAGQPLGRVATAQPNGTLRSACRVPLQQAHQHDRHRRARAASSATSPTTAGSPSWSTTSPRSSRGVHGSWRSAGTPRRSPNPPTPPTAPTHRAPDRPRIHRRSWCLLARFVGPVTGRARTGDRTCRRRHSSVTDATRRADNDTAAATTFSAWESSTGLARPSQFGRWCCRCRPPSSSASGSTPAAVATRPPRRTRQPGRAEAVTAGPADHPRASKHSFDRAAHLVAVGIADDGRRERIRAD
jgi:hypothetical protein